MKTRNEASINSSKLVAYRQLTKVFQWILVSGLLYACFSLVAQAADNEVAEAEEDKRTGYTLVPGVSSQRLRLLVEETNGRFAGLVDPIDGLTSELQTNRTSINKLSEQLERLAEELAKRPDSEVSEMLIRILAQIEVVIHEVTKQPGKGQCITPECDLDPLTKSLLTGINELKIEIGLLTKAVGENKPDQDLSVALTKAVDGLGSRSKSASTSQSDPVSQIPLVANIFEFYPDAEIEYLFVSLPDPRVPRHRRTFENSLDSITSGFSNIDFTLDRYYFPWQNYLDEGGFSEKQGRNCHLDTTSADKQTANNWPGKHCFGILIYRQDSWRNQEPESTPRVKLRVLYIIPETVTYGVMKEAVAGAIGHLSKLGKSARPLQYEPACEIPGHLVVAGPAFSGSVYSISEAFKKSIPLINTDRETKPGSLCLVSWSATANSNQFIKETDGVPVEYHRLGNTDAAKIEKLKHIINALSVEIKDVYFYLERSTFGKTVCVGEDGKPLELCGDGTNVFTFSANIADIRAQNSSVQEADQDLPFGIGDTGLDGVPLDDASENGSEYPTSHQSLLSVVGMELSQTMRLANLRKQKPKIIVVAATEVRDRLYLIRHFRQLIPGALVIDFETDIILSHPAFVGATRGMLQLGSAAIVKPLSSKGQSVAQSEHQVLLRNFFRSSESSRSSRQYEEDPIEVHVIGRDGPLLVTDLFPKENTFAKPYKFWVFWLILGVVILHWLKYRTFWHDFEARMDDYGENLGKSLRFSSHAISYSLFIILVFIAMLAFILPVANSLYQKGPGFLFEYEWDTLLVLVLLVLVRSAFNQSHVWSASDKTNWLSRLKELPIQYSNVYYDRFGITASVGTWLGILAVIILVSTALEPILASIMGGSLWAPAIQFSSTSGLTWLLPFFGIVMATAFSAMMLTAISVCRRKNEKIWSHLMATLLEITGSVSLKSRKGSVSRAIHSGFMLSLVFILISALPLGLTAFGRVNDMGFFVALCGTTLMAGGALCLASQIYERLEHVLSVMKRRAVHIDQSGERVALFEGRWSGFPPQDEENFSKTVIAANPKWTQKEFEDSKNVANLIWSSDKAAETTDRRMLLRELISRDIWCIRKLVMLILLGCLASVLLVYCYPVPSLM